MIGAVVSLKELSWEDFLKLKTSGESLHKLSVVTGSMTPLIPVGSTVVVDKLAPYQVNDIIVFWHNKKLVVHVLWSVNKNIKHKDQDVLVTRALNSRVLDASISQENILGKVVNYKLSFWDLLRLYVLKRSRRY
jgi:signal peptidase I